MKISDFLVPKWKNSNPSVRLKAVDAMSNDETEILEQIVFDDKVPEVRLAALKKIGSETVLEKVIQKDSNDSVKDTAADMLNRIKVEKVFSAENQSDQLALIETIHNPDSLLTIFKKIDSPDLRAAIVEKTVDPEILCQMAEANCGLKAGTLIIDRINDINLLKKISEKASNKKIRRKAAEKITPDATHAEAADDSLEIASEENAEIICNSLSSAFSLNDGRLIDEALSEAAKRWSDIAADQQTAYSEKYKEAVSKLENKKQRLEKTEETISLLQNLCASAKELSDKELINNDLRHQADSLENEWEASKSGLNNFTIYNSLFTEFTQYLSIIHEKHQQFLEQAEKEAKNLSKLQALISSMQEASTDISVIDEHAISAFEASWNDAYFVSETSSQLNETFKSLVAGLREKIEEIHAQQRQKETEEIDSLVNLVKKASETDEKDLIKTAGMVRDAVKSWKNLDSLIPSEKSDSFNKYCDLFFDRLGEKKKNREWELWANLSLKKELCEKAEKAAESAESSENLTGFSKIIRDAQAQWKEIGPVAKEHSDALWETFQSACDRVYSICLKEKERLFDEAQEAVSSKNFNDISKRLIQIQENWNNIGSLPLALEKDLRDAFKQLCDTFFTEKKDFIKQQNKEREENYLKKVRLCEEAESLLQSGPDSDATATFKKLQSDWKKTGPAPNDKSDQIWERFKLACDTYFSKIEEAKPENLKTKRGYCEKAEEILQSASEGSDIRDACSMIITLQKNWKETGPVPQEHSEPLWQRFRAACDTIFQLRDEAEKKLSIDRERNREIKEALIQRAIEIVETTDPKSTADSLKELQKQWKETGAAPRNEEQELWRKFREINDSYFNKRREEFQNRESERNKNLKIKEDLCLTLELLYKIISDTADSGHVEQVPLAEQLSIARELWATYHVPGDKKATKAAIMRKVKELQTQWKSTGSAGTDHDKILWERYKKAGDLFYS